MPPRGTYQRAASLQGQYEAIRADYQAAKSSRFRRRRTGVASGGSGADYHYRGEGDYLRLIEQARDMDRNDAAVGPVINQAVNNALQTGFTVAPATGDKALDLDLWERWRDWSQDADQCDLAGEHDFFALESFAYRQMLADGDIVALMLDDGSLQMIEAHRIRTPKNTSKNVVHGVLLSERRRREQYWVTKDDIDPGRTVTKVSQIEPYDTRDGDGFRQVAHVYNPRRVTQTRGVTALAPIFDTLGMFEDVNFAHLVKAQVASCLTFFRERTDEYNGPPAAHGEQTTETLADGSTRVIEGLSPGLELTGAPGEKLSGFAPNIPNPEFFPHVRLILTLVGINLGLPLVLVLMDASETNFSGFRGAVDQARIGFRRNQKSLIARFHTPIWCWKVRDWMAGDAALRSAYARLKQRLFAHVWTAPTWPYIEPMKDAMADLVRVRNGLISPRRLHAERGRDWEEIAEEIVADNLYAIREAKRAAAILNGEFPEQDPVHWRELLSLPTPDGVQMQLAPAITQATREENDA